MCRFKADEFFGKRTMKNLNINAQVMKECRKIHYLSFLCAFLLRSIVRVRMVYFCGFDDEDEVRVIGTRKESPFFAVAVHTFRTAQHWRRWGRHELFQQNRTKSCEKHHHAHKHTEREWHKIVIIATINTWGSSCIEFTLTLCICLRMSVSGAIRLSPPLRSPVYCQSVNRILLLFIQWKHIFYFSPIKCSSRRQMNEKRRKKLLHTNIQWRQRRRRERKVGNERQLKNNERKKLLIQKKLVLLSALFKHPNNFIEFWIFHNYVNQNHKRKNMKSAFFEMRNSFYSHSVGNIVIESNSKSIKRSEEVTASLSML